MIALFALASAIAYLACIALIVARRAAIAAGDRRFNLAAVALFVLQRSLPQNSVAAAAAAIACIAAIFVVTRRSTPAGGTLAVIPLGVMLLVIIGPLFPRPYPHQFQVAEEVLLCAAAPAALFFGVSELLRRKRGSPTTSFR